jgi:hypothetical protein
MARLVRDQQLSDLLAEAVRQGQRIERERKHVKCLAPGVPPLWWRVAICPGFRGVWFLESSAVKEDSDARRYPPEVGRQVIELARSGTKMAALVEVFGVSEASIYNWLRQDRIDRAGATAECTSAGSGRSPSAATPTTTP